MKRKILLLALCLSSSNVWAGVYKCTDVAGHTDYQSSPCTVDHKAVQMNTKTGSSVDLNEIEQLKNQQTEQKKQLELQQQAEQQAKLEAIALRKQQAREQNALTQAMIKQNATQFSAYAIPAYDPEKLPDLIKPFELRLPEIEKFRRLAAQKALASGKCQRVEADELSAKSVPALLVISVNCSSGSNFYFSEAELKE